MNKLNKRELFIVHEFIADAVSDAEFDMKHCTSDLLEKEAYRVRLEDLNSVQAKLEAAILARPGRPKGKANES